MLVENGAKAIQWRKIAFEQMMMEKSNIPRLKKEGISIKLTPYTKINSK